MNKLYYALYDLANSAYTSIIITFVISAYFATQIVGDPQLGASYWQWTAGLCSLAIALTSPLLGSRADNISNGKINYLKKFTYLCILTTCLFWFAKPDTKYIFYTLIIFFISNYFYELALMFYNSLLKKCSNENDIGKTSGFGFALGYIGSVPILLIVLYVFVLPENNYFGLSKNEFENIRFIPFVVAIWFLIFALPMIINFTKNNLDKELISEKVSIKKIIEIVWKNKFTNVGKFLLARMIYADALIVLTAGGGVYASGVFAYTTQDLLSLAIFGNVVAFVGVIIGGYLNDKFNSKKIIILCIVALTFSVIYISLIAQTKNEFFYSVMFVSLFIGSIQSASRVLMAKLLDNKNLGKGFGLFSFSGRATSFAGPMLVGTTTYFFSQRIGLLSVSILFILGFFLMLSVKNV
jgi:UMF1 family MFS transporter|tara:strand:+ start:5289 stop:6518 length:1230 start_codon:yes stop_codon:yes gene_type:complete